MSSSPEVSLLDNSRRVPGRRARRLTAALAAAAALGALPAAARADGFTLGRLQPTYAGDRFFAVESAGAASADAWTPHAMVFVDYARDPLVLRGVDSNKSYGAIVGNQAIFHVAGALAIHRIITASVDLPIGVQTGDHPSAGGESFASPTGGALGDLRLGVRASLIGGAESPIQLALGALIWFPTGNRAAYLSDGSVRAEPEVILSGFSSRIVWSVSVGPELRGTEPFFNVRPGTTLHWGGALGVLLADRKLQIGPEVTGALIATDVQKRTVDAEVMAGARYRFAGPWVGGIGAGTGLSPGIGTPSFRGLASIAFSPAYVAPVVPVFDRDHDGIPDGDDACPDVAGVPNADPKNNGCPPVADRDGDGIPDALDACPDKPGVPDPVPTINGCPPDRDNDGIPDAEDACPDQLGDPNPDPKKNGCPADRDGDGVPDRVDACPDIAGAPSDDPTKNGCPGDGNGDADKDGIPDRVDACPNEPGVADPNPELNGCPKKQKLIFKETKIVLVEQVEFDTGKATIHASSNALLDSIAAVMKEHPEILKLEVGGHTDNRGADDANLRLSQLRAEAVVGALGKRGVAPERLKARGYGATQPIMSNLTTQGRQVNRRVELKILEKR